MSRAATATIDLGALCANYQLARSLSPHGQAMAIIKANAYGHGAVTVAHALANHAKAPAFGVACIEEAVELRDAGIKQPILLLEGFFQASELPLISDLGLWCAVHSEEQIDQIAKAQLSKPIQVWLKMDSGMHRLGIAPENYRNAFRLLSRLPQVERVVLMSHFSSADDLAADTTAEQMLRFNQGTEGLVAEVSLANSAGTLGYQGARQQWQRPGIMLYGASPFPTLESKEHPLASQLQPVMSLTSEVIAERIVNPGEAVGYSRTWIADKPTRIGTVAMGYADGYPRHAGTGTPVMVDGVRTQIIGRVSMDMLAVDLSMFDHSCVGKPVELWGKNISANEVADHADTIPYTLFCGVTRRVKKIYVGP